MQHSQTSENQAEGVWAELTIPHNSGPFAVFVREPNDNDVDKAVAAGKGQLKAICKELVRLTFIGGDEQVLIRPELLTKAARCYERLYHAAARHAKL